MSNLYDHFYKEALAEQKVVSKRLIENNISKGIRKNRAIELVAQKAFREGVEFALRKQDKPKSWWSKFVSLFNLFPTVGVHSQKILDKIQDDMDKPAWKADSDSIRSDFEAILGPSEKWGK